MKKKSFRVMLVALIGLIAASAAVAQDRGVGSSVADKYIISAKAGGVNHREGTVSIIRSNGTSGTLLKGDRIEIGDQVSTGVDGRAEILLNPGSYIRLAGNSSFEFGSTDLEDLQIRLEAGSAMFEVFATNEFRVSVFTPKGKVALVDSGVYRIDISGDGTGKVSVTEGTAEVGSTIIKKGRTGTIGSGSVIVAKFDRGKRDEIAEWSRSRAKELAKMTSSLRNESVSRSLLNSFNRGGWGIYDSFGLWVYNPFLRSHCFLPFGGGWYSPYGYGYRAGIDWYNLPTRVVRVPSTGNTAPPTGTSNGQKARTRTPAVSAEQRETAKRNDRIVRNPPFTMIEKRRETSRGFDDSVFPSNNSGRGGFPVYAPQSAGQGARTANPGSAPITGKKPENR